MAYREFYQRADEETPDYSPIANGVASLFQSIESNQKARRDASDAFKYTLDYGQFENDNEIIQQMTSNGVNLAKSDLRKYGQISNETRSRLTQYQEFAANSKAQAERLKALNSELDKRADDDKYFDYTPIKNQLRDLTADYEVNAFERGRALDQITQRISQFDPATFKRTEYTSDYVNNLLGQKTKQMEQEGVKYGSASTVTSPFLDYKTGKNEVTDEHAIRYINSKPEIAKDLDFRLSQQLDQEIKSMKASGDKRTEWMNGLSDAEIKNELINDPSKNLINQQDYGVRKRNVAKEDLRSAAKITEKVSYETKRDMTKTGGLYDNDKISHGYFTEGQNVGTNVPGSETLNNFSTGGNLYISSGTTVRPITIPQSTSKKAFNVRNGQTFETIGSGEVNVTGYQPQIYRRDGSVFPINANNLSEFKERIDQLSDDFILNNLDKNVSIALRGYTVNRSNVLGELAKRRETLETQLAQSREVDDQEKIASLEGMLASLEDATGQINNSGDEFSAEDMMSILRNQNINLNSIRTDLMLKASDSDLASLNQITEGLNLKNRNKWSPEMKQYAQVYEDRVKKAMKGQTQTKPEKQKNITAEEFNTKWASLKSGDKLTGPDGKIYVKK